MSEELIPESERKLVKDCVAKLMEHFGSVRVFVTLHSGGTEETASFTFGGGDYYAQFGKITEWVIMQNQEAKNQAMKDNE